MSFTQAAAVEQAQALASVDIVSSARKAAIKDAVGGFRFGKGFGATLRRLVLHGIGVHHAGMLPKYRRLVETLAQAGLLAVICGTDTLGVGINVPIRTVLLTSLTKYDGRKQRVLRAREFHQIAGRAGRAGFDTVGYVVVQAPEHVIENAKAVAKAGDDPKKRRKVVRRKAPEGTLTYTEATYERLVMAQPEPLVSQMRVNHAMVLNVLDQWEGQQAALHTLLLDNHEEDARQDALVERAVQVLGSLLRAERRRARRRVRRRRLAAGRRAGETVSAAGPGIARGGRGCRATGIRRPRAIGELLAAAGRTPDLDSAGGGRPTPDDGVGDAASDLDATGEPPREPACSSGSSRGGQALRRGSVPGGARAARRVRAQPAAVGVRARRPRAARPRGARATRSTSSASSRPRSTTRGPSSWRSASRHAARRSAR